VFIINHIKEIFEQGNDIYKEMQTMAAMDQTKWEPTLLIQISTMKWGTQGMWDEIQGWLW